MSVVYKKLSQYWLFCVWIILLQEQYFLYTRATTVNNVYFGNTVTVKDGGYLPNIDNNRKNK